HGSLGYLPPLGVKKSSMNSDRTQTRTRASCRQSCCRRSNEHACTLERPEEDEGKHGQLESMTVFSLGSRPPHKSHLLVAENSTDCLESVAASQSCNTRTPRQRWMSASAKWLGLHRLTERTNFPQVCPLFFMWMGPPGLCHRNGASGIT
uniref:Uncharacterized protein n=1 Tax=Mus spicilegus TaxID=10103 RepID=A0A8C6I6S6_MUSSI